MSRSSLASLLKGFARVRVNTEAKTTATAEIFIVVTSSVVTEGKVTKL